MPKNLLEAHSVAPMEATGKTWKIRIIQEGKGSSAIYPREVLEAQSDIVKAKTKIYVDHPSLDEAENRPERSARDIIGYFTTDSFYEDGKLFAEADFFSDSRDWVKERAEAGVIGMSIRGSGEVDESGTLTKFDNIYSVDLVTTPGAGGGFEEILESRRNQDPDPNKGVAMDKEIAEAFDTLRNEFIEKLGGIETAVAGIAPALTEALKPVEEGEKSEAPTAAEMASAVVEAELPKEAHARVFAAVENGTDLAEAVKAEVDYIASLSEAQKDKGGDFRADLNESKKAEVSFRSTVFGAK